MQTTTFLMFQDGQAGPAIEHYLSVFPGATLESIEHYGPGEDGPEGTVKGARLRIGESPYMVFDSPIKHGFAFTPSISIWVETDGVEQLDSLAARLLEGGDALMPANSYGFSTRFAWVQDRFGVSWQLNAP
jgi:predicted 3-demethylubiquinone-9 3-methyltransferase (glyoxalase superfamily)